MIHDDKDNAQFDRVCLGGTFDHLHAGHKRILDFACHAGKELSIGISTDSLLGAKHLRHQVQSYEVRKDEVMSYLAEVSPQTKLHFFPLNDIFGIAGDDQMLDAIVVTEETKPNAEKINKKRISRGLPPLMILTVPFYRGPDHNIVRSERIRRGHTNRFGDPYMVPFLKKEQLNLPKKLRELLRQPLGLVVEGTMEHAQATASKAKDSILQQNPTQIILVGDIVTQTLAKTGLIPHLSIIDNKTRRRSIDSESVISNEVIDNPPGTIQQKAVLAMHKLLESQARGKELFIRGEEDLLALPAILLAPLGSVVIYGQFDIGIIITPVTEEKKEQIIGIIRQFK